MKSWKEMGGARGSSRSPRMWSTPLSVTLHAPCWPPGIAVWAWGQKELFLVRGPVILDLAPSALYQPIPEGV